MSSSLTPVLAALLAAGVDVALAAFCALNIACKRDINTVGYRNHKAYGEIVEQQLGCVHQTGRKRVTRQRS
jgi:hypothetical protein